MSPCLQPGIDGMVGADGKKGEQGFNGRPGLPGRIGLKGVAGTLLVANSCPRKMLFLILDQSYLIYSDR